MHFAEWRVIDEECIAFFVKNILHYNVHFDQHENIESLEFEGGLTIKMDELVVLDGVVYHIVGVRDIVKIPSEDDSNVTQLWQHPFDLEVRLEAQKLI
jgi:hypothetical protein